MAGIVSQKIIDWQSINIESDHSEWVSGTTYNFGDDIEWHHYKWRSTVDNNTDEPSDRSSKWVNMGITSRHGALDSRSTTVTRWTSDTGTGTPADHLEMTILSVGIEYLAFVRTHGAVKVEQLDAGGNVVETYDKGVSIWCGDTDWLPYYNAPKCESTSIGDRDAFFFHLTPRLGGTIRISVYPQDEYAEVGALIGGTLRPAGCTQWGIQRGIESTGNWKRDDFGVFSGRRRTPAGTMSLSVSYDTKDANSIYKLANDVMDTVCLFIGDDTDATEFAGLVMLASAKFSQTLSNPARSEGTWTLQEAI